MNRKISLLTVIMIGYCLYVTSIAFATTFSNTYDKTTPAGTDAPSVIDDRIREVKLAVQERENVDHYWPYASTADVAGGNEVASAYTGEHRKITFYGNITDPTQVTGKGHLYMKGGELYYQDATNTTLKMTSSGDLYSSAGLSVAVNAAITGTLDVTGNIDPTSYETTNGGFKDEDSMASASATNIYSGESIKAYVDNNAAATKYSINPMTGSNDSIGTITFPNGLIWKWGTLTRTGINTTLTFATAFPNACFQVIACGGQDAQAGNDVQAHTITASSAIIRIGTDATPARWFAVGR